MNVCPVDGTFDDPRVDYARTVFHPLGQEAHQDRVAQRSADGLTARRLRRSDQVIHPRGDNHFRKPQPPSEEPDTAPVPVQG